VDATALNATTFPYATKRPRGFLRKVKIDLDPIRRANLTAFCRHYGIVDEQNRPRNSEAVRLLGYCGLNPDADPYTRAFAVARIQVLMSTASLGYRMSEVFATASTRNEPSRTDDGSRIACMRYDTNMLRQLGRIEHLWRDEHGRPRDEALAYWLLDQGFIDPNLHATASVYAQIANSLYLKMREIEAGVVSYVNGSLAEWASALGLGGG
jgi:hypothetical protein